MKIITNGTEKQNKWANEIIRKPVENVSKRIADIEHWVEIGVEKDSNANAVVSALRGAISRYESRLEAFADDLTAEFVIEWRDNFCHMMQQMLIAEFKAAGLNHANAANFATY